MLIIESYTEVYIAFVSGAKSNNPLSPDYIPSIFSYTSSLEKKKQAAKVESYDRRMSAKKRKFENVSTGIGKNVIDTRHHD